MGDASPRDSGLRLSFLTALLVLASVFLLLTLIQPLLPRPVASVTGTVLSATCHRLPGRSVHMPWGISGLCTRCTAFWAGTVTGCLIILLTRRRLLVLPLAFLMLLPMVVDGSLQQLGLYESNALLRGATGFVCGVGLASVIASLSGRQDASKG